MRLSLLLSFAALLSASALPACTGSRATTSAGGPAATVTPATAAATAPVLIFGRTPCFGKCPHFIARVFADGRVEYEGFRYAPVEGKREAKLRPETVRSLLQAAEKAGFRQMQDTYSSGASDMPSTGLTITYPDGTTKSVRAEDNVPAELQSLFTRINAEIDQALGVAGDR